MKRNDPETTEAEKLDPEAVTAPEHHSVYCPTCGDRLFGHRCKLVCRKCGYYLSCADYY